MVNGSSETRVIPIARNWSADQSAARWYAAEPVNRGPIAVKPRTYSSDFPPRTLDRARSRSASALEA